MDLVTNPAECRFHARIETERMLSFGGPGGFTARAELVRGDLGGLIGTGFLAISKPGGKIHLFRRNNWKVRVPRTSQRDPKTGTVNPGAKYDTRGENRRIMEISGPEVAVLVFDRPIPKLLTYALQIVFEGASFPRHMIGLGPQKEESP